MDDKEAVLNVIDSADKETIVAIYQYAEILRNRHTHEVCANPLV